MVTIEIAKIFLLQSIHTLVIVQRPKFGPHSEIFLNKNKNLTIVNYLLDSSHHLNGQDFQVQQVHTSITIQQHKFGCEMIYLRNMNFYN